MLENKEVSVKNVNIFFIVGLISSVLSSFLPWYSFEMDFLGEKFVWFFYPVVGWTTEKSYEFTPPDMSMLDPYFIIFCIYTSIFVSFRLINSTMEEKKGGKFILYLIYFGAMLMGFIYILFIYLLITQDFYFPYLQIDMITGDELINSSIYSAGLGSYVAFFSLIPLIFSACCSETTNNLNEDDSIEDNQIRKSGRDLNSLKEGKIEEIRKSLLKLNPREMQYLEKKFVDAKMNSVKKRV